MMECKAMTTPMESNLNLLSDASSDAVDATMYHQMICSLMYLMNMRPDICFVVNTLSQFQCYRNQTETGKIGRSDQFTGLVGPVSEKKS